MLGEASHVVAQGFVGLLSTPSEIPGVLGAHLRALEVAHDDFDQVSPVMDLVREQMLKPRSCGVGEVKRKVADGDRVIRRTSQLTCQAVVVELDHGIDLSRVLDEGGGLSKARGKGSGANLPTEHTGARRLR